MLLVAAPLVPHIRGFEGLRVLLHRLGIVLQYPGYGVLMHLDPRMPERHPDVGRRHPHPRQHQGQRDVQARHLAVLKTQIVPEPPSAHDAPVPLPFLVLATVPSVAGILLFLAFWAPQFLLLDVNLLAGGGLGRYEQRVFDRRDMLASAPFSGGVVGALARRALARKRDPVPYTLLTLGCYVPAVPGQGLDLVSPLVYEEPAARYTLLRGPALPGFAGFLASHACPDPTDCLRS